MAAMEPLCLLIGIDPKKLSKKQNQLLEGMLYARIGAELKEIMRHQYKHYFDLMKLTKDQGDSMIEEKFIQNILNDIISSKKYDLQGIACYTDTHVDVIYELMTGINTQPSALCFRKIIELDRTARPELYQAIGEKIATELAQFYGHS